MKRSKVTLFVLLAIVMSLGTVPAVFAGQGPGLVSPSCTDVVAGEVIDIVDSIHTIVVYDGTTETTTTIVGVPLTWIDVDDGDEVVVNYFVSPDGKNVACYLTINGGPVIELRPRQ